ncbi:hypothetical protein BZG36_03827 [Bifiguratus adelaidae]|uniref:Polymerase/histidinol phosphatase N-terminal domain-containing protein n=1 Tax=Bifiguratus adelaidae TaxID=1938954 RepID=A0A261XZN2_9FUNG|nr:hypothetical protein BZG36_03827 [Bifiguratus adelaidae]
MSGIKFREDVSTETLTHQERPESSKRTASQYLKDIERATTNLAPNEEALHSSQRRADSYWQYMKPRILPYLRNLCQRILTVVITLAILILVLLLLRDSEGLPEQYLWSEATFDWPQVNPASYLQPFNTSFGPYNVVLDGHSHTTYSDGRMTPEQSIQWHIANGYNAVFVTDHNTVDGGLEAERIALEKYSDQIVVIPGMEYSCCRLHMNFININETVPVGPPVPTDEDIQAAIARAHELGGLAIINHIPWSNSTEFGWEMATLPNHPSLESLVSWGLDGIEVVNQATLDEPSLLFAQKHNLLIMTGTDMHYPYVAANAWTIVNAANFSKDSIMSELLARRNTFYFDPTGTRNVSYPPDNPAYYRLASLLTLADFFGSFYTDMKGMYSFQGTFCQPRIFYLHGTMVAWFVGYIIIAHIFFEIGRGIVIAIWHGCKRLYRYVREDQNLQLSDNVSELQ